MNNSSTGGILLPHPQVPALVTAPPNLTLVQFIQTLLVGLSNIKGPLVRPDWQPEEPKQPDIDVNWVSFGIKTNSPDANAYQSTVQTNPDDPNSIATQLGRQETLTISLLVYGPNAMDNISLIRDGFEVPQNLTALKQANMGFVSIGDAQHTPDLINERWVERYACDFILHRVITRTYPILNFVSSGGTVYAQTAANPNYQKNWQTGS